MTDDVQNGRENSVLSIPIGAIKYEQIGGGMNLLMMLGEMWTIDGNIVMPLE